MKSVHMTKIELELVVPLPYYIHSPKADAALPVLLFLHGVGEGFVNRKRIGHENALKQGPPKWLPLVAEDHPLRTAFTLIVPQLPERDTLWSQVVADVKDIVGPRLSNGARLYVMGFSKGGLGAFQIAAEIGARALVAIDASPMHLSIPRALEAVTSVADRPYWAVHTTYGGSESLARVQQFNEGMNASRHEGLTAPAAGKQWRTTRPMNGGTIDKHVGICDEVSKSPIPYQWLLQHP
jgi:hypothetical protein